MNENSLGFSTRSARYNTLVAFLCGVVRLSTFLTGWINSFWLSFSSVTVFVIVVVLVCVIVWDRVLGASVFVSRILFEYLQTVLFAL